MGASSSAEEAARAQEAEQLQKQREALEAERIRLEKVALEQHWTEKRLQEEQRLREAADKWRDEQQKKEAVEKWRREQQLKAELELQRKKEELKVQEILQNVRLNIIQQQQQVTATPVVNSFESTSRETVPVQQRVSPGFATGSPKIPNDASTLATAAPPTRPTACSSWQGSFGTSEVVSVLPKPKQRPRAKNPNDSYATRMSAANVRYKEWSIVDYVTDENALNKETAASVIKLLDDNTVPFIARYRRGVTDGMEEDELRNIKNSYERAKLIKQRAVAIVKAVEKQGKWTPELHAFVHESKSIRDLERIDSIFKVTKTKDADFVKIAESVVAGKDVFPLSRFVDPAVEGRRSEAEVKDGIIRVLADTIKRDIRVFDIMKKLRSRYDIGVETNFVVTNEPVTLEWELNRQKYLPYDKFKSTDKIIAHTDISNIRRGEAENVLTVRMVVPPPFSQAFKDRCSQLHSAAAKASSVNRELISAAIDYMYDKWARPSIENWTRNEIDEKAEIATTEIIVQYVKRLLLGPALRGNVVIGVFSLSQWVCKLAVVSERGDCLDSETVYPHNVDNPGAKQDAETKLVRMVKKYKCTTLAVGNGAACKENKRFIVDLIKKKSFLPLVVFFRVVDEAGLLQQFYSSSNADASEFPTVAAVSIARRLQDPMAEFVKIEPKHLVGKTHQQDVREKQLTAVLNDVFVEAVSSVGVDLNTASAALLGRVAGLDDAKAKSIVERRDSFGLFTNRNDLKSVKGIGIKTFEQCAGFVRIMPETAVGKEVHRASRDSFNYLDQTSIHPNSYDVAKAILEAAKCNVDQLGTSSFIFAFRIFAGQGTANLAKRFGTSKDVIELIINALTMERAPKVDAKANLDEDVSTKSSAAGKMNSSSSFDKLTTETVLTGVVCEIKPFGAFVKVGLGRQGLIHNRNMNGMTLSVGQRVEAIVVKIDKERRIFGLRLLRCL